MGVLFDADADQIAYGDVTFLDGLTTMSFSLWVKLDSVASGRNWVQKWGTDASNTCFILTQASGDGNDLTIGTVSAAGFHVQTTTANILSTGAWAHYLMTYTAGGNQTLYQNNTVMLDTFKNDSGGLLANAESLTFGQSTVGAAAGLLGSMAEVACWNRVLNSGERTTLQTSSPSAVSSGLVFHAPLNTDTVSLTGPQPTGSTGITFTDHPIGTPEAPPLRRTQAQRLGAILAH